MSCTLCSTGKTQKVPIRFDKRPLENVAFCCLCANGGNPVFYSWGNKLLIKADAYASCSMDGRICESWKLDRTACGCRSAMILDWRVSKADCWLLLLMADACWDA